MDFSLSEDQLAFLDVAREFAQKQLAPYAAEWDEQKIFPVETLRAAGALGFCGMYCPEQLGGTGLSRMDAALLLEELAQGCTSTAAYISIHNMAAWMVATWGSADVQAQWLGDLAAGRKFASYCLTEANAGSDASSIKTSAQRFADHYVINGAKAFISGAGDTDVLVVMARTGGSGPGGISAFVVPSDTPGVSFGKNETKMGWNSQATRAITFEDARIPAVNRLGDEGEGFAIAMRGLEGGRINIAACSLGAAQATLDMSQRYLGERKQFDQPLADFQALQFRLADMATELVAARQMVHKAAWALDTDHAEKTAYCAMAKRFATDVGFNVCNQAMQLHGGYGYLRDFPIERFFRDARVHQILEGTNEVMRVIIARRLLQPDGTEKVK
ncbi:MAG: acyl-CoA dehydrogenase family protein [Pseudomonadota bacterium]|nr:acyl-CoA dehydrogenase family protein [Pseudomonadota bacterium]